MVLRLARRVMESVNCVVAIHDIINRFRNTKTNS